MSGDEPFRGQEHQGATTAADAPAQTALLTDQSKPIRLRAPRTIYDGWRAWFLCPSDHRTWHPVRSSYGDQSFTHPSKIAARRDANRALVAANRARLAKMDWRDRAIEEAGEAMYRELVAAGALPKATGQ